MTFLLRDDRIVFCHFLIVELCSCATPEQVFRVIRGVVFAFQVVLV